MPGPAASSAHRGEGARVHAEVRRDRTREHPTEDLVDILLIAGSERFDAAALRGALEATFEQREQQPLPSSLPAPPASWREPYSRLATDVAIEPELDKAFSEAAEFLDPILAGRADGEWDPQRRTWT